MIELISCVYCVRFDNCLWESFVDVCVCAFVCVCLSVCNTMYTF